MFWTACTCLCTPEAHTLEIASVELNVLYGCKATAQQQENMCEATEPAASGHIAASFERKGCTRCAALLITSGICQGGNFGCGLGTVG